MAKKIFWCKYNIGKIWHRVPANSREEALGKMLKGTKSKTCC